MIEYYTEQIRIYLSPLALKVIEQDVIIFSAGNQLTITGYINKIIFLYLNNDCEDFLLNRDLSNLIDGESKLFRFSKKSMQEYNDSIDYLNKKFSDMNRSTFFKTLLETYTRLSFIQRESFFLKETIEEIEKAIRLKKLIKVATHNRNEDISPFEIISSKEGVFSYLIGFNCNGNVKSIRLSHIQSAKLHDSSRLPKESILEKVNEQINEYGATFLEEKPVEIVICFLSLNAEQSYKFSILHRPFHVKVLNEEDRIYQFFCSLKQAEFFFFRFAGEIEIIKPLELKKWFINKYKNGLNVLSKQKL